MPRRAAALIWTRSQAARTCWISSRSTWPTIRSCRSLALRAGGADALADQLGGQGGQVAAPGADRPGGGLAAELRREVLGGQLGAVAQDDGPLDVVLQLADVARPVVVAEQPHRLGVDPADLAAVLLGVALQEELDQERDVVAALAEGGQVDRHDVEPVVQVLAEPAGVDLVEQVAVGRGDDPGVDLDRSGCRRPARTPPPAGRGAA